MPIVDWHKLRLCEKREELCKRTDSLYWTWLNIFPMKAWSSSDSNRTLGVQYTLRSMFGLWRWIRGVLATPLDRYFPLKLSALLWHLVRLCHNDVVWKASLYLCSTVFNLLPCPKGMSVTGRKTKSDLITINCNQTSIPTNWWEIA